MANPFYGMPKDPINKCPKDCRYIGELGNFKTCDYILIHGVKRGCPGGKHCTKYAKGDKMEMMRWGNQKRRSY